ncbi:hypothetical protein GJ496_011623 [Pomphorhynchus laevis]|nr:hypothetical protein GJ496_011623 [Pomphorhynchus laevis]
MTNELPTWKRKVFNVKKIMHALMIQFILCLRHITFCTMGNSPNKKGMLLSLTPVSVDNEQYYSDLLQFTIQSGYDIWNVNAKFKKILLKVDSQTDADNLYKLLIDNKLDVDITVVVHDITKVLIDAHSIKRNKRFSENSETHNLESLLGDDYLSFNDYVKSIRKMKAQYKQFVRLKRLGKSWNNQSLLVIRIELPLKSQKPKKIIWIDAGIHGREWISPASIIYFTWMLLDRIATRNDEILDLMENFSFYIMPFVNPDGYIISFVNRANILRFWRKNARPSNNMCTGVDLNRNFPFAWNETNGGASTNPCSEIYRGPEAQSEPEVKAITNFIGTLQSQVEFVAFLTFHSYGQFWFYPWGYTKSLTLIDKNDLETLAKIGAYAMTTEMFDDWKVGQSSHMMYLSSGTSEDWAKAIARIKYTYCIELPPGDDSFNGFVLPKEYIRPVGTIVFNGIINLLKEISRRK